MAVFHASPSASYAASLSRVPWMADNAVIYGSPGIVARPVRGIPPASSRAFGETDEDRGVVLDFVEACRRRSSRSGPEGPAFVACSYPMGRYRPQEPALMTGRTSVAEKPQPNRHEPPQVVPGPVDEAGWTVADERLHDAGFHEEPEGGDIDLGYDEESVPNELAELAAEKEERQRMRPTAGAPEELVESFIELFNARDLDGLLELLGDEAELPGLGDDRDGFGRAIQDVWERSPSVTATLGRLARTPVAMLWMSGDRQWWRVGVVVFDGSDEALDFAQLIETGDVVDQTEADAPEHEQDEGTTWPEWDEGAEE